jgi:hypothetical protein
VSEFNARATHAALQARDRPEAGVCAYATQYLTRVRSAKLVRDQLQLRLV